MTLWLVTLVNHNVISGFLLFYLQDFFVYLYTCDILIDQCHLSVIPKLKVVAQKFDKIKYKTIKHT